MDLLAGAGACSKGRQAHIVKGSLAGGGPELGPLKRGGGTGKGSLAEHQVHRYLVHLGESSAQLTPSLALRYSRGYFRMLWGLTGKQIF